MWQIEEEKIKEYFAAGNSLFLLQLTSKMCLPIAPILPIQVAEDRFAFLASICKKQKTVTIGNLQVITVITNQQSHYKPT